jgi:hypothetical protein
MRIRHVRPPSSGRSVPQPPGAAKPDSAHLWTTGGRQVEGGRIPRGRAVRRHRSEGADMAPDLTAMDSSPLIIAAGLAGLAAMTTMILRGQRGERDRCCEGRAEREAALSREADRSSGAGANVVDQRGVRQDTRT